MTEEREDRFRQMMSDAEVTQKQIDRLAKRDLFFPKEVHEQSADTTRNGDFPHRKKNNHLIKSAALHPPLTIKASSASKET